MYHHPDESQDMYKAIKQLQTRLLTLAVLELVLAVILVIHMIKGHD